MAARNKVHGGRGPPESTYASSPIAPMGDVNTRYYVSMKVADAPVWAATVAGEFSARNVSIATVRQGRVPRRTPAHRRHTPRARFGAAGDGRRTHRA